MSSIRERIEQSSPSSKKVESNLKKFEGVQRTKEFYPIAVVQYGPVLVQLGISPRTAAEITLQLYNREPPRKKAEEFINLVLQALEPAFKAIVEGNHLDNSIVLSRCEDPPPDQLYLGGAMARLDFLQNIIKSGVDGNTVTLALNFLKPVLGNPSIDWKGAQEIFKSNPGLFGYQG